MCNVLSRLTVQKGECKHTGLSAFSFEFSASTRLGHKMWSGIHKFKLMQPPIDCRIHRGLC